MIKVAWWLANNWEQPSMSIRILIIITFKGKLTSVSLGTLTRPCFAEGFSYQLPAECCSPGEHAAEPACRCCLTGDLLTPCGFKTERERAKEKLRLSWWLLHLKRPCWLNVLQSRTSHLLPDRLLAALEIT